MNRIFRSIVLLSGVLVLVCHTAYAQSNPLDKKLQKAIDMVNDDKLDKADEYMVDLLDDHPEYGDGWDLLVSIRSKIYDKSKATDNIFGGNMTITVKSDSGTETQGSDSLARQLMDLLNKVKPSAIAYSQLLLAMRKGTLSARDAYNCSAYLRILNVDVDVDSNINKKALNAFNEAEQEFGNKNYGTAAKLYQKAIDEQPDFFKARMYLGDCYYFTSNYPAAITAFKEAKERYPDLLEPRKYLTDALHKEHLYDQCLEEAIQSMTIYPDYSMNKKIEDAAYLANRSINIIWTPRAVLPIRFTDSTGYVAAKNEKEEEVTGPWKYYVNAFQKIAPYCSKDGMIIKDNPLTTAKYMEVYAWEEMLRNSKDPILDEARKMQNDGYLDCYVLVSCFHYDFYDQYRNFAANNKIRIISYYHNYTRSK